MDFTWQPEHREYLDSNTWGVLATGRRDGSPQQSMVGYVTDDDGRIVISVKSYTAKWHNAVRQPCVSLVVPDGRRHLVVYGSAEAIATDPHRAHLSAAVFGKLAGTKPPEAETLVAFLDEQHRTVLRITPTSSLFHE